MFLSQYFLFLVWNQVYLLRLFSLIYIWMLWIPFLFAQILLVVLTTHEDWKFVIRSVSRAHHHNRDRPSVSLNAQTTHVQHKQSIPQRPEPAVALLSLIICILNSDGQSPSQSSLLLSSGFGKIGASQLYFLEPNAAYYRYELKCPLSLIRWTVRGRYKQPLWKLWCWPWRRMTLGGHILLNCLIRWVGCLLKMA